MDETTRRNDADGRGGVDDAFVRAPGSENGSADGPTSGARTTTDGDRDARLDRDGEALLDRDRATNFRRRWEEIQTGFVDRPRESVEEADRLVLEVVQQLQASFTLARERLESQWSQGDDASTEDLRLALRRYRSFFDRLLAA
jgi:hypothetical protein